MDLSIDSAGPRTPDPSKEGDTLLSPFSPTSFDAKSPASETRESWMPNRRVSDSPTPPDADPANAMGVPSPTLLETLRLLRSLLLPLVAVAYIVFCYTVHFKTVSVRSGGFFDDTPNNIAVIKSGVTSISIIIIGLGLLPIYTLIADLRSEEFFRITSSKPEGTPLGYINGISNPSFGMIDSFNVVFRRHCSLYYFLVLVATILAIITSTLAPAALSVETALFDSDIQAFAVGAIKRDDLLNMTSITPTLLGNLSYGGFSEKSSTLAWVENTLEVPYSFQVVEPSKYVVPAPLNLPMSVPARWLSDVAVMDPTCTYPTPLPPIRYSDGDTAFAINYTKIALDGAGVTLLLQSTSFLYGQQTIGIGTPYISNTTDTGYPVNGAMVFMLSQCVGNCSGGELNLDLSGLPTIPLTQFNSTYNVAFLVCSPNVVVETREIRNDGHGRLTVMETSYTPKQGNLHPGQTAVMFSNALGKFDTNAGPQSAVSALGSESQAILLFGPSAANFSGSYVDPPSLRPLPGANISENYARMLQSATKTYLHGAFSTAYVPGRLSVQQLIFASSLPQVIASTVLFIILSGISILSHFRRTTPHFTLFSVAAALDGSEIPSAFAKAKSCANPKSREVDMVAPMGRKMVVMGKSDVENDVLHLS